MGRLQIWEGHGSGNIQFAFAEILERAEAVGGDRRGLSWIHDTFLEERQKSRPILFYSLAKPKAKEGEGDFVNFNVELRNENVDRV